MNQTQSSETEQLVVNVGDHCPASREGLDVFTPFGYEGAYSKWLSVNGKWERSYDGDYRQDKSTGRFRKVPHVVFMMGYTPEQYSRWLDGQGFAV